MSSRCPLWMPLQDLFHITFYTSFFQVIITPTLLVPADSSTSPVCFPTSTPRVSRDISPVRASMRLIRQVSHSSSHKWVSESWVSREWMSHEPLCASYASWPGETVAASINHKMHRQRLPLFSSSTHLKFLTSSESLKAWCLNLGLFSCKLYRIIPAFDGGLWWCWMS